MSWGINFSGFSDKRLVGKALRLPLKLIPVRTVVPIWQGRLRGRRWIVGSSNHGCWLGSYEYSKQQLFAERIRYGSIVFDIGAHVGFYTLLASELVGSDGRVYAFEPVPRNLFYLKRHLQLNRITNVTVIEAAVSDSSGVAYFDEGPGSSMGHLSAQGTCLVKTIALDEMISGKQIPVPDCLKVDVEGAEMLVLRGAESLLTQSHPIIFLATHSNVIHQQCCHLLDSLDYALHPINGPNIWQSNEILAESR